MKTTLWHTTQVVWNLSTAKTQWNESTGGIKMAEQIKPHWKITARFVILYEVNGTKQVDAETKGLFLYQTDIAKEMTEQMDDIANLNDDTCWTKILYRNFSWQEIESRDEENAN